MLSKTRSVALLCLLADDVDAQAYFDHSDPQIYLEETQCLPPCMCCTCERLRARCIELNAFSSDADTPEKPTVMTDDQCLL